MKELIVISRLLEYPDQALWDNQAELQAVLAASDLLDATWKAALSGFVHTLCAQPLLDAQASYGALFDRGRATSLLLFEHVHGESRDRGQAMVDLLNQYQQAGLVLNSRELPDHLPLYLEYLATRENDAAIAGLRDIVPILMLLHARLTQRDSTWAVLFAALLALCGSEPDSRQLQDRIAGEARDDTPQALDAVWEEEQVKFLAAAPGCENGAVNAHQRRFAGAVSAQYLNLTEGEQR